MKSLKRILLLVCLMSMSISFYQCDPDDDDDVVVYKPNIYIYPESVTTLDVSLDFPLGGEVIESEPVYGNGWHVTIEPNGLIDGTYNYLFYESKQPEVWQYSSGWIIERANLEDFFNDNLKKYGFNEREIKDFVEYWIPLLKEYDYYYIYPQTKEVIEKVIQISISKPVDQSLRLFYAIKGTNSPPNDVPVPLNIPEFNRDGFVLTEWGVILK